MTERSQSQESPPSRSVSSPTEESWPEIWQELRTEAAAWAREVWQDFSLWVRMLPSDVRSAHRDTVQEAVRVKLAKLDRLSALDEPTRDRIRPMVAESEELVAGYRWKTTLERLPHVSEPLAGAVAVMLGWGAPLTLVLSVISLDLNTASAVAAVGFFVLVMIARGLVHKLLLWRRLRVVARVVTAGVLVAAAWDTSWWAPPLVDFLQGAARSPEWTVLRAVQWPATLEGGMWLAALFAVLGRVWAAGEYLVWQVMSASAYRSPSLAVQNALVLDEFLALASIAERAVNGEAEGDEVLRGVAYLDGPARLALVRRLDLLAERVCGPWAKAMRTGDRSVDGALTQQAKQIAIAIRRWQPRVAQGGQSLDAMREAFALAVVNICDGDWHLMAAPEPEEATSSRVRQALAKGFHVVCSPLLFVAAWALVEFVPGLPTKHDGTILLMGGLASLAYLANALNPRFMDVLTTTGSLTQAVRGK